LALAFGLAFVAALGGGGKLLWYLRVSIISRKNDGLGEFLKVKRPVGESLGNRDDDREVMILFFFLFAQA